MKTKNFIHRDARRLMRQKLNACRTLKKTTDPGKQETLRSKIKQIEEDLRKQTHKKRMNDENKARKDLDRSPIDFFNLVRKLTKKSDKVGPLKRSKETKNWPTCEIISSQYSKVFSTPREENKIEDPSEFFLQVNTPEVVTTSPSLTNFEINTQLIGEAIDKLPPKSAPGPDGISNYLLKQLKQEIIPVLYSLFTKSVETCTLPSQFLKAYVKPLKKTKKPRCEASSYRPVSLTSGLSKIFEHVIKKQVQSFLEENNKLRDNQHGFRPTRSCLSQLLSHYNNIILDLEQGKVTDVIYLDFAKAFDSVDIEILSKELKIIGINGKAGLWLHNFLSGRKQQIIAENQISKPANVLSGVPQGTVLGPLMFLIMINSLSDTELEAKITMFADDTRLSHGIKNKDDIKQLQADLDKVFVWQKLNNMQFNGDKFQHLSHGRSFKNNRAIPRGTYLDNDGDSIKTEISVRDLGIEISAASDFSIHINSTCKRARDKIAWIYRTFYARDVKFLAFMWRTYVQPILDYGCQLWAPYKQGEIKKLEDIFKNFSSRAQQHNKSTEKLHFWHRIVQYRVKSQQRRQERFRIICIWKILNNLSPNCSIMWNVSEANGILCNIPSSPYDASRRTKTLREGSFQVQGPALFNCLPLEIRAMSDCSLNSFKNALDSLIDLIPDTPSSQTYFPAPTDRLNSTPSNSLVDWMRYLGVSNRRGGDLKTIIKNMMQTARYQETKIIVDPSTQNWINSYKGTV